MVFVLAEFDEAVGLKRSDGGWSVVQKGFESSGSSVREKYAVTDELAMD